MEENQIGRQIAENRRAKGLTQEQLAEEFGVSPQAVSKWENGASCPDILILPQLADFFGITVDELLRGPRGEEVRLLPPEERKNADEMLIKIIVDSDEGDRVRIKLPLSLVRIGLQIGLQIPQVGENPALKDLDFDKIFDLVEQGVIGRLVEVDTAKGEHVEIVVE
ncbi:helix-turn-helix domain-containing protein [Acetanaerobacterium sp. MSJ-12]|uniref:helix-turn-helix domain-containing protein n=1 Tax=Oscillospiraceae TaxID=216572 RepID=UPI00073E3165|nr:MULTISPECIES: helix-turn-helix domain-containing protein [Oscillospiraceae]MBU5420788.1 helix-turn-helix domain-containing protein [Acetanaerobacterium sp. MSJ-12]